MVAAQPSKTRKRRYVDKRGKRSDVKRVMDQLRRKHPYPRGSITEATLTKRMTSTCHHCHIKIDWSRKSRNMLCRGSFDRISNLGAHTLDNIVPSCLGCNLLRNKMDVEEYHTYVRDLVRRPGEPADLDQWDVIRVKRRQLSLDNVRHLFKQQGGRCYLTGVAFEETGPRRYSVDRLDSSKGYTLDNVGLCLININFMKSTSTPEQAKAHWSHFVKTFGHTSSPSAKR